MTIRTTTNTQGHGRVLLPVFLEADWVVMDGLTRSGGALGHGTWAASPGLDAGQAAVLTLGPARFLMASDIVAGVQNWLTSDSSFEVPGPVDNFMLQVQHGIVPVRVEVHREWRLSGNVATGWDKPNDPGLKRPGTDLERDFVFAPGI